MDISFFKEVEKFGGKAFYVGGYVRDMLLGFSNKDIDIEVWGLRDFELINLLEKYGKVKVVGKFQVYLVNDNIEIYLNLSEVFDLEESAKRRDITINSLYYDPLEDKVYDYLGGKKDLEDKVLRYSSKERFLQDPIRILRVGYFHAKYDFFIDNNLKSLILQNKNLLKEVAKERIFLEFEKIFELNNRKKAFELLNDLGILEILIGVNINLDKLNYKNKIVLWTILVIGGSGDIFYFIEDKFLIETIKKLIKAYKKLKELEDEFGDYWLKKIAYEIDMKLFIRLHYELEGNIEFSKNMYKRYLFVKTSLAPLVLGRDLVQNGMKPNERFSEILDYIHDLQLRDETISKEKLLIEAQKRYKEFTNLV